ncbi:acetyltransferase [Knoellia sinensis KCTC 19936]|uniref:Acetyltransferase n=1 Tax=Knoellia sinensis KCTC 19936 TaxID=1385520 RepID=A0A0A0J1Q1_9MICO|nr:GNAT family N-acetyltransferase [Knoellia sinensis]KGN30644.1 acetyltransferase [Knoellia sinensis KCTC 19936]
MGAPTAWVASSTTDLDRAAVLLHAFNTEYDDPTPAPPVLAQRLTALTAEDEVIVLLARAAENAPAEGVAVLRIHASVWSLASEAYLAELYVSPDLRGQGLGRALLALALDTGRENGADYAMVVTSADDVSAQFAYRAAGFRTTEGEGGPELIAFERDL